MNIRLTFFPFLFWNTQRKIHLPLDVHVGEWYHSPFHQQKNSQGWETEILGCVQDCWTSGMEIWSMISIFFIKGQKKFHMCVEKYLVPDAQAQVYPWYITSLDDYLLSWLLNQAIHLKDLELSWSGSTTWDEITCCLLQITQHQNV